MVPRFGSRRGGSARRGDVAAGAHEAATMRAGKIKKLLALGAVSAVVGCGSQDGNVASSDPFCQQVLPAVDAFMAEARAANPTPDDGRYGGTVVVGTIGEMSGGMNSAVSSDFSSAQHQQFVNLMTLLDYDSDMKPRPYLAESWDIAPGGTSITFHLRRDVRWHDGEQTDAHDVVFTYETVTNPLTAFPNAASWKYYVKGPEGVEILDDFTVRMHLEPHTDFLDPFRTLRCGVEN